MSFGVSIIVCCYNSAKRLPKTIECLSKQKPGRTIDREIIFVNNNSTDDTIDTILFETKRWGIDRISTIVDEEHQGLIYAKWKGWAEARKDILIFCDDDNWLQEDYVSIALDIMVNNSTIGVLGGDGIPVSDVEFPSWFEDIKFQYAVGKQGVENGDVTVSRGFVWGAGMVIRKTVLNRVRRAGFKSQLVGRNGENLNAGEDTEICYAVILAGYRIWYSSQLIYRHFIPRERLTKEYFKKLDDGIEACQLILDRYRKVIRETSSPGTNSFFKAIKCFVVLSKNVCINCLTSDKIDLSSTKAYLKTYFGLNHLNNDPYSSIWKLYYSLK